MCQRLVALGPRARAVGWLVRLAVPVPDACSAARACALSVDRCGATMIGVTDEQRLQQMIDELRRMRDRCEPKSNQNPRYLRYSNAVSALRWVIDDLAKERAVNRER